MWHHEIWASGVNLAAFLMNSGGCIFAISHGASLKDKEHLDKAAAQLSEGQRGSYQTRPSAAGRGWGGARCCPPSRPPDTWPPASLSAAVPRSASLWSRASEGRAQSGPHHKRIYWIKQYQFKLMLNTIQYFFNFSQPFKISQMGVVVLYFSPRPCWSYKINSFRTVFILTGNLTSTGQTPSADDDHVVCCSAPEHVLVDRLVVASTLLREIIFTVESWEPWPSTPRASRWSGANRVQREPHKNSFYFKLNSWKREKNSSIDLLLISNRRNKCIVFFSNMTELCLLVLHQMLKRFLWWQTGSIVPSKPKAPCSSSHLPSES